VGIQERLHGSGLYVANPGDVLGFALARSDFSFLGSGLLFIRLRSALAFISVALLVSLLFTSFALLGGRLLLSRTRSICLLVSRSRLFSSGQTYIASQHQRSHRTTFAASTKASVATAAYTNTLAGNERFLSH
jgi:hypothetical protein